MVAFRPIRDRTFLACKKSEGGSDAMDVRPIKQKISQVQPQLFLRSPADRNDHMPGTTFLDRKQQRVCVLRRLPVRHVTVVSVDRERASLQPGDRLAFGGVGGNDPIQFLLLPSLAVPQQTLQISDSRNFVQT